MINATVHPKGSKGFALLLNTGNQYRQVTANASVAAVDRIKKRMRFEYVSGTLSWRLQEGQGQGLRGCRQAYPTNWLGFAAEGHADGRKNPKCQSAGVRAGDAVYLQIVCGVTIKLVSVIGSRDALVRSVFRRAFRFSSALLPGVGARRARHLEMRGR
jgi:hypothetical protein